MTAGKCETADTCPAVASGRPSCPRVAAVAAGRIDGRAAALDDVHHYRTGCATAATSVVRDVEAVRAAHVDDAGAGDAASAQDRDAAAGSTRGTLGADYVAFTGIGNVAGNAEVLVGREVVGGIVGAAGAATAAEEDPAEVQHACVALASAAVGVVERAVEGTAADAATREVAAAAAAGVVLIVGGTAVGSAAAGVARRAARARPVGIAFHAGVDARQGRVGDRIGGTETPVVGLDRDEPWRAGDTFRLATVRVADRIGMAPVGIGTVGCRPEPGRTAKSLAAEEHRSIGHAFDRARTQRDRLARIDRYDAACETVPCRRGHAVERRIAVARHTHDLIALLPRGGGSSSLRVGVRERGLEGDARSGAAAAGGADEFVQAGTANRRRTASGAGAAAVVGGVARVDQSVLDLDDDQHVARGDRGHRTTCAHRAQHERGVAGCENGVVAAVEVAVDDAAQGLRAGDGNRTDFLCP
jgi:hypothetical protein